MFGALRLNFRTDMELSIGALVYGMKSNDPATEQALVERCRRRDGEAFAKIVDAYQNRVYGFVRRMVSNPDEAADIAQDVFIRAFQNMHRFDGRASLRTWLFRIAHNLCIDRARKLGRLVGETSLDVAGDEEGEMEVADQRWDPETLVMDREMHEVVEAALASMSEKLRVVLLLHDREDLAYEEIAETLGLPVGTVKSRLFLARAHLQREVGPYLGGRT